jgi:hypothetical protein
MPQIDVHDGLYIPSCSTNPIENLAIDCVNSDVISLLD